MRSNKHNLSNRKSIRLQGYDYSQSGLYFITIVINDRRCLFGDIINGKIILNDAGEMVKREWLKLPQRFLNIKHHQYITMPNHFHGIIEIDNVGAPLVGARIDADIGHHIVSDICVSNDTNNCKNGQPQNGQPQNGQPQNGQPQNGQPQNGQPQGIAPTGKRVTVGGIVGAFKSITTNEYIRAVKTKHYPSFNKHLWQRNYWEHIIRDHDEDLRISQYIIDNPCKWNDDKLNGGPGNIVMENQAIYGEEIWMV